MRFFKDDSKDEVCKICNDGDYQDDNKIVFCEVMGFGAFCFSHNLDEAGASRSGPSDNSAFDAKEKNCRILLLYAPLPPHPWPKAKLTTATHTPSHYRNIRNATLLFTRSATGWSKSPPGSGSALCVRNSVQAGF